MKRCYIFMILLSIGMCLCAQGINSGSQRSGRGFSMEMPHREQIGSTRINGNTQDRNRPGSFRMSSTRQVIENGRQRTQQIQTNDQRKGMHDNQRRTQIQSTGLVGSQIESQHASGNRSMQNINCDGFRMSVPRR